MNRVMIMIMYNAKIMRVVGSSKSYCNNNQTYFFGHPVR